MVLMNLLQDSDRDTDMENRRTQCGKERVGQTERVALKHVHYQM